MKNTYTPALFQLTLESAEQWKDIPGFEGQYQVSDQGRVKRISGSELILRSHRDKDGYQQVHLWAHGKTTYRCIHILVMSAFVGPRPEGCDVDHINAYRDNNSLSNLRYLPASQNRAQGAKHRNEVYGCPCLTRMENRITNQN